MVQGKSVVVPVVIAVLATAMIVGAGFMLFGRADTGPNGNGDGLQGRVTELEEENTALRSENEELQSAVAALEAEVEELRAQPSPGVVINRQPREGWEEYFPTAETTTLDGESTDRVRELLGEPPFLIRSIAVNPAFNREIWIFAPFEQDPTGLYLFFKGGELDRSRLDEFNGLYGSGLLDEEQFWLQ